MGNENYPALKAQANYNPDIPSKKNLFLITSPGQMATFWLASQLNKHPMIFCSHSYDYPAWGAEDSPLEGEDGKRQRKVIQERFSKLKLNEFFKENSAVTNKINVGNVHAYSVQTALNLIKNENLHQVSVVNLIRHPIPRINSLYNCIKNEWFDFNYFDHLSSFFPQIYEEHGKQLVIDCFGKRKLPLYNDCLEKQFFIVALILERGTAHQINIAKKNTIHNIKYEDITTNKETMRHLIQLIGNELLLDDEWLENKVTYKKLNAHTSKKTDDIASIYSIWEKWQQQLYKRLITDPNFKVYTDHYYDRIHY